MINKSLPQLCLMLPVCPILVFQLNWKPLSIMGTFDGPGVENGWKGVQLRAGRVGESWG